MRRGNTILALSVFLGVVIFLCGCATVPKAEDTEAALRSAASDYWKMRIGGKLEDTFKMEDKERLMERKAQVKEAEDLPLNEFYKAKATVGAPIKSYSIKDVKVDGNKGRVDLEFGMPIPSITQVVNQMLTDEWIFKDGKWLHLLH